MEGLMVVSGLSLEIADQMGAGLRGERKREGTREQDTERLRERESSLRERERERVGGRERARES